MVIPPFIQCCTVQVDDNLETLLHLLGHGESEAIILAKSKNIPLVIDEKKGRKIASNMGIRIIVLLGLLYLNIKRNYILKQEAQEFLDQARANGFRISQKLIDEMLENLS